MHPVSTNRIKIIESSDDDEAPLNAIENQSESSKVSPSKVIADIQDESQFRQDSSDEEIELESGNAPAQMDEIETTKAPTKKDRQEAYMIAQRALRELHFELPKRNPILNLNQFLSSRGVTRKTALEDLNRSLRRSSKLHETITKQVETIDASIELRNHLIKETEPPRMENEGGEDVKKDHLIPLVRLKDQDSDSEIELIVTDAPSFPLSSMKVNLISTAIAERNKEMVRLASMQAIERRETEFQQKKLEVEALKRKRKERKEARLRKMAKEKEAEAKIISEEAVSGSKDDVQSAVASTIDTTWSNVNPAREHFQEEDSDDMSCLKNDSGSEVDFGSIDPAANILSRSLVKTANSFGISEGSALSSPKSPSASQTFNAADTLNSLLCDSLVNPDGFRTIKGVSAYSVHQQPVDAFLEGDTQEPVLDLLSGTFGTDPNEAGSTVEMNEIESGHNNNFDGVLGVPPENDLISEEQSESEIDEANLIERESRNTEPDKIELQNMIYSDSDLESSTASLSDHKDSEEEGQNEEEPETLENFKIPWNEMIQQTQTVVKANPTHRLIETEAEVEEDEFMNEGGLEGETNDVPNQYDKAMLNDSILEPMNEQAVLELHQKQIKEEDDNQVSALINDVTSGALRKRKSNREASAMGLDLYDSDEETEAILRKIRMQMGVNTNRSKEKHDSGSLISMAMNPKTQAFAKCFMSTIDEEHNFLSSDSEAEIPADQSKMTKVSRIMDGVHQKKYKVKDENIEPPPPIELICDMTQDYIGDSVASLPSILHKKALLNKQQLARHSSHLVIIINKAIKPRSNRLLQKKSFIAAELAVENISVDTRNSRGAAGFKVSSRPAVEEKPLSTAKKLKKKIVRVTKIAEKCKSSFFESIYKK